jgi:hypothetical protein
VRKNGKTHATLLTGNFIEQYLSNRQAAASGMRLPSCLRRTVFKIEF